MALIRVQLIQDGGWLLHKVVYFSVRVARVVTGLVHVNQHDEGYLSKPTSGLAFKWRCGLLSNYFDHFFTLREQNEDS